MAELKPYARKKNNRRSEIMIGNRKVGEGHPAYIVAEVGINHNGSLDTALALIDNAVEAGCDAVKFQKRSPDHCVPVLQRDVIRETPWGTMSYIQYRHRMEFGAEGYGAIDRHCQDRGIAWFASCWDKESVDFIRQFKPVCYKIASACLTDDELLRHTHSQKKPIILSTGMSIMDEIRKAISILDHTNLIVAHTTSNYIGNPEELNLSLIKTLEQEFDCLVGYSGHEEGAVPTIAAIALGACYVERHITPDRNLWGSDHAISLEPNKFKKLVGNIRLLEKALGDGVKRVYDSEKSYLKKLRCCT